MPCFLWSLKTLFSRSKRILFFSCQISRDFQFAANVKSLFLFIGIFTWYVVFNSSLIYNCRLSCGNVIWFTAIFIFKRCFLNPMSFLVIFKCIVCDHWIIEFQTYFLGHRTYWTSYKNIIFTKRFLKISQVLHAKLRYLVGYQDIYKT